MTKFRKTLQISPSEVIHASRYWKKLSFINLTDKEKSWWKAQHIHVLRYWSLETFFYQLCNLWGKQLSPFSESNKIGFSLAISV